LGEKKLRVGVVGLGKMGLVHTSVLNVLSNVEVAALCDKSDLIRRFFRKVLKNVPILDDVEKLSSLSLDAVYVTTPIPYHYGVSRKIFQKKISNNVFVEKTLAASYREAEELCSLAERSRGVNMVGYLRRFYVTFVKAKSLLDEGKIGDVSSFKAHALSSDFANSETESLESGDRGGVLADLGCYAMDLALWFFGEMNIKSATMEPISLENNAKMLRFEMCHNKGIRGVCDVSWHIKDYRMPEVGFAIEGSRGMIVVNDDWVDLSLKASASSRWYRQDLHDNVPFWLGQPEYYREDEFFVSRVLDGQMVEPSFVSAAKVDKAIEDVNNMLRKGS
jgi:predicted dehydrogenase